MATTRVAGEVVGCRDNTGHPIVRVEVGCSHLVAFIDHEDETLNIFYVASKEKGDMKKMMDGLVDATGYNWVQFLEPLGENNGDTHSKVMGRIEEITGVDPRIGDERSITDAVDGFQMVEDEYGGESCHMYVGFWEPCLKEEKV